MNTRISIRRRGVKRKPWTASDGHFRALPFVSIFVNVHCGPLRLLDLCRYGRLRALGGHRGRSSMLMTTEDGIRLSYHDQGDGPPVLLLTGTGAPSSVWDLHQVPALRAAGFRVITMDNRGIAPSDEGAAGFTVDDLVADVAALLDFLDATPC